MDEVKSKTSAATGIVVIGRNEGERLRRCLESVVGSGAPVVYVDSASTDRSVEFARSIDVEVVELSDDRPLTAARSRNAGFERLMEAAPGTDYVQFVDGDCELSVGWLTAAANELNRSADTVIVAGGLRERNPMSSIYDRLCSLEWEEQPGESASCGGNCMVRASAFKDMGGFNTLMAAGEEPELCVRLRLGGWKILRIAADMASHDAQMTRFGQWWRRSVRSGRAYAEGATLHGRTALRHHVRQVRSAVFWGFAGPAALLCLIGLGLFGVSSAWWGGAIVGAVYGLLGIRIFRFRRRAFGNDVGDAALYAIFCLLAKIPQVIGVVSFHLRQPRQNNKRRETRDTKLPIGSIDGRDCQ